MQIEFTPRGLLATFFRQRGKFFSVFFLILALGVAYILIAKPKYEGSGSLLVKFGQNATPDLSRAGDKANEVSQNDRRELMQSNLDLLQSHDLIRSVVQEVGVERLYPGLTKQLEGKDSPTEVAVQRLVRKDLAVRSGVQSNLIEVAVLNPDPQAARETVSQLFSQFIARESEVYNKPQTAFLAEQVRQSKEQLQQSQARLQEFKATIGISSIEEELQQLMKDKGDASNIAFQGVDDAQAKIIEYQAKEAELLLTYNARSPAVQQVRRSLAVAQGELKRRQKDMANAQAGQSGMLSSRLAAINQRIQDLEMQRTQFNDLQRQVTIDEENYKNYVLRQEEARVNTTLNEKSITRVSVVDAPTVSARPVRPRKLFILIATLMAAGILAAATAVAFETLDERFGTPMHLASTLKVPVLASFSAKKGA